MSNDVPEWSKTLASGGAILGAVLGYTVLGKLLENPDAGAAEAGGRAMASTMLGILAGAPAGALLGFGIGKILEKLKIKH